MLKIILTAVLLSVCLSDAYKILIMLPIAGKSHGILGDGLVRHLLNAGHEVTRIMAFPHKPHPNLTNLEPEPSKAFSEDTLNIKALMDKQIDLKNYDFLQHMMMTIAADALRDEKVQKFLKDPNQTFDLVIGEWMFSELYASLGAVYDCPFIWFSSLEPHWMITRLIDEPLNPAYNADLTSDASPPFSFLERFQELWIQIKGYLRNRHFFELEKEVYQSSIVPIIKAKGRTAPSYEDVVAKVSLVLGNSHVSLGLAPRLPQNYKPIGGYHIDTKLSPLPQDLQKLLDNSKHGVIYFSMGSNLKSKDIPENLKKGFLKIFSGLKQTVLWKFEEVLPDLPKNVHILKWAPQPSILAHPNCILFITHGGLLSTTEAVHYGKPLIGIPVFADQFMNVKRALEKGFGQKVELSYTMDVDLKVQIDEVLSNPSYAQKAKEWSFIYHDRPVSPGQEVVHWSEHVIKTGGAAHLRSAAILVPWYQKLYLDLIALVLVAVIAVAIVLGNFLKGVLVQNKKQKKL